MLASHEAIGKGGSIGSMIPPDSLPCEKSVQATEDGIPKDGKSEGMHHPGRFPILWQTWDDIPCITIERSAASNDRTGRDPAVRA